MYRNRCMSSIRAKNCPSILNSVTKTCDGAAAKGEVAILAS